MAIYDNTYGLPQSMIDYLNQGLPDISGINTGNINPIIPVQQASQGIADLPTNIIKEGGGAFNPYMIDPDDPNIRTSAQYNTRPLREANPSAFYDIDNPNTMSQLDKSGTQKFLESIMPGRGIMSAIGSVLPVGRRGIMENQMLGAGIRLNDIGQIVAAPGKYNTREGIMAGYNLSARPQDFESDKNVFNKRTKNITETLLDKYKGNITREQIQEVIDEIEETGEYTGDITDESIGAKNLFSNLVNVNKSKFDFRNIQKNAELIKNYRQDKKDAAAGIRKQNIKVSRKNDATGGSYDRKTDYSGASDRTAGDRKRTEDKRSSDLGFSDIRLKENVELIGKSPSNINIYKFNYKNNPTTYQGAMAHEVPWASIKHSSGYMMVDYNKIDVGFKKWQK